MWSLRKSKLSLHMSDLSKECALALEQPLAGIFIQIVLAPFVSLALAFAIALLCAPAACVSCVSPSLESESCCISSPMSPCSVSQEDPPLPPLTPPSQLPAGSAEYLVHYSTHPPLDWPWWTSSLPYDCLSSWTSSLVAFYTNIHQIYYFGKNKQVKNFD